MNAHKPLFAAAVLIVLSAAPAVRAQFRADAMTTDNPQSPVTVAKLYRDATTPSTPNAGLFEPNPGTGGDRIWFVADVNRDGPNTSLVTGAIYDDIANGILAGGDQLLSSITVNGGGGLFPTPGVLIAEGLGPFNDSLLGDSDHGVSPIDIYIYLWDGDYGDNPSGCAHFGVSKVTALLPPDLGNAKWAITQTVLANQHKVEGECFAEPPAIDPASVSFDSSTGEFSFSFTVGPGEAIQVESTFDIGTAPVVWIPEGDVISVAGSHTHREQMPGGSISPLTKYYRLTSISRILELANSPGVERGTSGIGRR